MATARLALRQRREQLGMSQEQAALASGVSTTTWRSYEAGTSSPRPGRRPRIARVLNLSLDGLSVVFGDIEPPDRHDVLRWLGRLGGMEQGAGHIHAFEPVVIHGLLQTAAYATAVETVGWANGSYADDKVRVRMVRQAILHRRPDPVRFSVILDESVLHRATGADHVMAEQLEHLIEVAALPTVSLQIMPWGPAVFPAAFGAFSMFTSKGDSEPHMVYTEDGSGPNELLKSHEIDAHIALFDHLSDTASTPRDSVDLIRQTIKERYL